ncbi:WD40/YVTN/BNR-like repeat-containing protein [Aurantibacter aestuarii]|nr:oxidoreductase [Aurantibacter aestuarii]
MLNHKAFSIFKKNITTMKYVWLLILVCYSCKSKMHSSLDLNEKKQQSRLFTEVKIIPIIEEETLNVRALEIVEDKNALVFLSSLGDLGVYNNEIEELIFPIEIETDSIKPNFRSLSARNSSGYGMSISSPAKLYKLDIDPKKSNIVYQEDHEKAFYDSLEFWNDDEGIAIGDPTDDCMSIIITRDGGTSWKKITCENLPEAKDGEAAFAASDTNIAIVGDKTWVATGGKASRILFSPDKGKTWGVFNTPIIQGLETTGMYSIDFYDDLNGFAIGGDYKLPEQNKANKIRTQDGGKTWELVAENKNPGYRSCVKYVPNSNAKQLVAVGFNGIDYSSDGGNNWKHLSDEGFYTLRFSNDSIAFAGGNGRVSKLVFK